MIAKLYRHLLLVKCFKVERGLCNIGLSRWKECVCIDGMRSLKLLLQSTHFRVRKLAIALEQLRAYMRNLYSYEDGLRKVSKLK